MITIENNKFYARHDGYLEYLIRSYNNHESEPTMDDHEESNRLLYTYMADDYFKSLKG